MPPVIAAAAPAIIGGIATAGASKLLSGGTKGGGGSSNPLLGFSSPGISGNIRSDQSGFDVTTTPERKTLIDQIRENLLQRGAQVRGAIPKFNQAFGTGIAGTRNLLSQVGVGTSGLREARLTDLENRRSTSLSNLRQNLSRRRVAGSSFAEDARVREELAFAQEGDRIEAESFLQEIELTDKFQTQLLEQEVTQIDVELNNFLSALQFEGAASQVELDEQEFLSGIGLQLATGAQASASSLKATELELAAEEAAGAGRFVEKVASGIDFNAISESIFGSSA